MTGDTAETGERWSKREHREALSEKQMERNSKLAVYFTFKTQEDNPSVFFL